MDLVDVRLFWGEGDMLANFVADMAEERVVDKTLYYRVLVATVTVNSATLRDVS